MISFSFAGQQLQLGTVAKQQPYFIFPWDSCWAATLFHFPLGQLLGSSFTLEQLLGSNFIGRQLLSSNFIGRQLLSSNFIPLHCISAGQLLSSNFIFCLCVYLAANAAGDSRIGRQERERERERKEKKEAIVGRGARRRRRILRAIMMGKKRAPCTVWVADQQSSGIAEQQSILHHSRW